ncbi:hypothetical protein F5Y08DRAFT_18 [Xylaria arbuscula]|nr:hypothetical protein F5Y08DRAFT_18 [Xylaria arbuscula]
MSSHTVGHANDDDDQVDQSRPTRPYAVTYSYNNLGAMAYSGNFAATGPQQSSNGFSNQPLHWSTGYQPQDVPGSSAPHGSGAYGSDTQGIQSAAILGDAAYMTENANQLFPGCHIYDAEPFPSMLRNAYTGNWSNYLSYQSPLPPENESEAQTPDSLAFEASPPRTRLYPCPNCPDRRSFTTPQDLDRHLRTTRNHQTEATRYYKCACGRRGITRKDNYLRHVGKCNSLRTTAYVCICNEKTWVKEEHETHIGHCGRQRSARTSNAH